MKSNNLTIFIVLTFSLLASCEDNSKLDITINPRIDNQISEIIEWENLYPEEKQRTLLYYNEQGNVTKYEFGFFVNDNFIITKTLEFEYAEDLIAKSITSLYSPVLNDFYIASIRTYSYTDNNQNPSEIHLLTTDERTGLPSTITTYIEYDGNNRIIKIINEDSLKEYIYSSGKVIENNFLNGNLVYLKEYQLTDTLNPFDQYRLMSLNLIYSGQPSAFLTNNWKSFEPGEEPVSSGNFSYNYNELNRLVRIEHNVTNKTPDGQIIWRFTTEIKYRN